MKPWEVVVFVLSGVFLVCLLTSCGIQHATQRVLTNEGARNQVGRVWANLNPCAVDSVVRHISDTTITVDTVYVDTSSAKRLNDPYSNWVDINGLSGTAEKYFPSGTKMGIPIIHKTITIRDSTKVDKADLRAIDKLRGDTAYLRGQLTQWKDRAAEAKKEARKWLWSFIAACIGASIGIGLYLRSLLLKFPTKILNK